MKKKNSHGTDERAPIADEDYDLPAHLDLSKMVRLPPRRRLHEGERVYLNDVAFIMTANGFVPDPTGKPGDNGRRPKKKD